MNTILFKVGKKSINISTTVARRSGGCCNQVWWMHWENGAK